MTTAEPGESTLVLVPRAITHPHASALVDAVQAEYVVRYGSPDETPLDGTEFEGDRGEFFVGYLGEVPVATGAWRWRAPVPDLDAEPVVELKRMFVVAEHRGRGLARVVLAHLEARAATAGARAMVLETGSRQPEAIGLYLSAGYREIAGFGHYAADALSRCFGRELGAR